MNRLSTRTSVACATAAILLGTVWGPTQAQQPKPLTFAQLAAIRSVGDIAIAPDGEHVAYTLQAPRPAGSDDDGPAWSELHVAAWDGQGRPFVHGKVNVSRPSFAPDGKWVTYLAKRNGDEARSLWAVPVAGGESRRVLTFDTAIDRYELSPDGSFIAFIAHEKKDEAKEEAQDRGYDQEVYEEDGLPTRVWIVPTPPWNPPLPDPETPESEPVAPRSLPLDGSAFDLSWSPDGKLLAVSLAPTPLIDDRYMAQQIHIVEAAEGTVRATLARRGKLGKFAFGPDGRWVAAISAENPNDPSEGRLLVGSASDGTTRDLLPDLEGHVTDFAWRDGRTLTYLADEGTGTLLGEIDVEQGPRGRTMRSSPSTQLPRPVLTRLDVSVDGRRTALIGQLPSHPAEVYVLAPVAERPRRLTDSNPWLSNVALAKQEVVRHTARDGLELEGILVHPLDGSVPAPLLLVVHGGPEGHVRNGWVTSYSRPGQLAAGKGYAVFYPNYRGSTGRGVAFSKLGQGDAAGKEFDDLIDAVDHLAELGVADRDRVGITGGSYGGYATAWCSTRFTERFRAGVMFVGISNKVSKGLTTEIPVEDKLVHTRFDPWTRWQYSLERSPIYYVEQARTPLLIAGGTADTRVHPSQSLQLYRALKLIGKAPVRYVRYPDEGHGNRGASARDDYARRLMRWMDHFVVGGADALPPAELPSQTSEETKEPDDGDVS